jgi:hypothetical protein
MNARLKVDLIKEVNQALMLERVKEFGAVGQ